MNIENLSINSNSNLKGNYKLLKERKNTRTINDNIIDIYTSIVDHSDDLISNGANNTFVLYAKTEKDDIPILEVNAYSSYTDDIKNPIWNTFMRYNKEYDPYNLSVQQIEHIFNLLKEKIFNNGSLNLNVSVETLEQFKANVTMLEILSMCYRNSESKNVISERLEEIKNKICLAPFDYLSRKEKRIVNDVEYYDEQLKYIDSYFDYYLALSSITEKIDHFWRSSDSVLGGYGCVEFTSNTIKKVLKEKLIDFENAKDNIRAQAHEISNNIEKYPNVDAEHLEKYMDLLWTMGNSYYKKEGNDDEEYSDEDEYYDEEDKTL